MKMIKPIIKMIQKRNAKIEEKIKQQQLQQEMENRYKNSYVGKMRDGDYKVFTGREGEKCVAAQTKDNPVVKKVKELYTKDGRVYDTKTEYEGYMNGENGQRDFVHVTITHTTSPNASTRTTAYITRYEIQAMHQDGTVTKMFGSDCYYEGEEVEPRTEYRLGIDLVNQFEGVISEAKTKNAGREQ